MVLSKINSPQDLKNLPTSEIETLCAEIRDRIIQTTSLNGGHVGPNLGVVELTVALHLAFDSPNDAFCWDVSHQGYVHKLLTGRNHGGFDQIRKTNGLSGFLTREESPHDPFGAGHAGTALSAALGMCAARDLQGKDHHVVALAGDAAFTCGVTLEALNNITSTTKKFILVLNDNEWSIAKNVGAFSRYFNELITNPIYSKIHKDAESFLNHFPGGSSLIKFISKAKRDTKDLLAPSSIFEKLGVRYLGPIDGHDVNAMVHFFEFAKSSDEPIVLHLLTQKGKGFDRAVKEPEKWHGAGPFNPSSDTLASAKSTSSPPRYQDVFASSLIKSADADERIVGITAAMPSGTGLDSFQQAHPTRFFDVGIAEEHAVLLAAGMAAKGLRPVCAIYSTFLQRAYDQILHDICLQKLPVTFCLDRAGLSPNDGPTHHGLFDVSYLRCIPHATIMQPKDENELQSMLSTALQLDRPAFIRYPRGNGLGVALSDSPKVLEIGKAEVLQKGEDLAIWFLGSFSELANSVADHFAEEYGLSFSIVNARFAKPLDEDLLLEQAQSHKRIVTIEDNVLQGGFGSAILETLSTNGSTTPLSRFGWPDQFIEHASSDHDLRARYSLDASGIIKDLEPSIIHLYKDSQDLVSY